MSQLLHECDARLVMLVSSRAYGPGRTSPQARREL